MKRICILIVMLCGIGCMSTAWGRGEYVPPPYGAGLGALGGWMEAGPVWGWSDPWFGGDPMNDPPGSGSGSGTGGRGGWGREFDPEGQYGGGGSGGSGSGSGNGGYKGGEADPDACFRSGPGPGPDGAAQYSCACISSTIGRVFSFGYCSRKEGAGNADIGACSKVGTDCVAITWLR